MPLPPFIKSPACLSGLGAAGSGVISIGGWQFVEGVYPTADKQLTSKNLLFKPAPPALEANTSDAQYGSTSGDKYHLQTYECFKRFFPGATVNHSPLSKDDQFEDPIANWSGDTGSGDPVGCALMNLSYEGVSHDSTTHTKYVFKSEITVKNDTFGWALWVGSKYMKTGSAAVENDSNQKGAEYYLLFLEKKENNNDWSIIGGYLSFDSRGFDQSYNLALLQISTLDKENWAEQIRNHKGNTKKEHKEYSGVWIASGAGKEVFQDIELWYGYNEKDKSEYAEILGRVDTEFSKNPTIPATRGYDKSSGWRLLSGSVGYQDVGETLAHFYKPFKDKKGIWTRSEEYCRSKSYSRGLNTSQLEELKSLCYSEQTSK